MKRPMIFAGMASLLISVAAVNCTSKVLLFAVLFVFAAALIVLLFGRRSGFYRILPIVLLLFLISAHSYYAKRSIENVNTSAEEIDVCGIVGDVDYHENSVGYTVKSGGVTYYLISTKGLQCETGDRISVTASPVSEDSAQRTQITAFVKTLKHKEKTHSVYSLSNRIRNGIRNIIFDNTDYDTASVLLGLTIGDKEYISDTLSENIRRAGISHAMVVSGMHLAIIAGGFIKLCERFRMGRRVVGVVGMLLILLISVVTGFTPSVLRAGITYVIMLLGMLLNRRPDAVNSLFAAVAFIVLTDPFVCVNVSFQLSCSATYGVLVLAPKLTEILARRLKERKGVLYNVISVATVSVSALLTTLPFTVWHFGTFSAVCIATNIFTSYATSAALTLAVVGTVLFFLPFFGKLLLLFAGLFTKYIILIINALGGLQYAEINLGNGKLAAVFTGAAVLLLAVYCFYDKKEFNYDGYAGTGT